VAAIGARALTAVIRFVRKTTIAWCFSVLGGLVGLGLPGTSGAAQQFSADLVATLVASGATQTTGKIYVSKGKVRTETPDFPKRLFLLDGNAHTAYFVKPAQQVMMDPKQSTWLTQILVPLDPSDPCRQRRAMADIAGAASVDGNGDAIGQVSKIAVDAT
jgi:hypothetical protein